MVCTLLSFDHDLGKSGSLCGRKMTEDEVLMDSIKWIVGLEKPLGLMIKVSVLKPTQVGEASSLR